MWTTVTLFLCLSLLSNPFVIWGVQGIPYLKPESSIVPPELLAPHSNSADFSSWVVQAEEFQRDYQDADPRLVSSGRSRRTFSREIRQLRALGERASLTITEKIFLARLLNHLQKLAKFDLIFKHVGFVGENADAFLAGIAYPYKIGLEESFFNPRSTLHPFLPIALLTLATRSIYLTLPEQKRSRIWDLRLKQLARKLFDTLPDFNQALWEWRIQTQLQEMGNDPWKYRKSPPIRIPSSTTYHDENEEQFVISTLDPNRKISGLQKAAQFVVSQFDEGRKFVFLGLADDTPNQILTLPKMTEFLYRIIDEDSRPTHIVIQIPKFQRVNIKRIFERVVSTGKSLQSGEVTLLQRAFQTNGKGLKIGKIIQLMTLFKMFYHFNFFPPAEHRVQVVVLNENEHNSPPEFVLFKQTVLETVLKDPNARVLMVTELKHAERNSALRGYFQTLFPEEVMRSFVVSPPALLDADFVGVTLGELNYKTDFVLKGLPDIDAIKGIKVKHRNPIVFEDFDALICLTKPKDDNDGQEPNDDQDNIDDLPPFVDAPSGLPIPVGGDDYGDGSGPDWELAWQAQFAWDDGDDDLFGRSL